MSRYLIDRIKALSNVTLYTGAEVIGLEADESGALCSATFRGLDTGNVNTYPLRHLFLFIGADPNTTWLDNRIAVDGKGFVVTGRACPHFAVAARRDILPLETSLPGVFAIGDVRAGLRAGVSSFRSECR